MDRNELEGLAEVYESGFSAIEDVLDDAELSVEEKLEAIEDVVRGEEDEPAGSGREV